MHLLPYSQKFFAGQKFHQAQLPLYYRNIRCNKFHQYSKGCHMLYVIINTGQKSRGTKFSITRSGGEISEDFLLVIISGSTVFIDH